MLSLSMPLRTRTRLALLSALELTGGATQSIFTEVEALLFGNSDYQRALEYVAARKKFERYCSVIDFLFCELHPEWRASCFRFYNDEGPQLKDQITEEQIKTFENRILKALEVAYDLHCQKRRKSWRWFQEQVEEALKAA